MASTDDAAQWLTETIGLGGVFTKEQLRQAFPHIAQIDRRVRDLRARGWIIHTRREDPALTASQMRLVAVGGATASSAQVSSRERRKALLAFAFSCAACGAAGSSTYLDANHVRVQLQVVPLQCLGGALVPVCSRCVATIQQMDEALPASDTDISNELTLLTDAEWAAICMARVRARLVQPEIAGLRS